MGSQALIFSHFNSDCNFTLQTSHLSFVVGRVLAGLVVEQDCLLFVRVILVISNYCWSLLSLLPPPTPPDTSSLCN